MNYDLMDEKVGKTIERNTSTSPAVPGFPATHRAEVEQDDSRGRKDKEEQIVSLEHLATFRLMVVAMERPEEAVHYILVRRPSNGFHRNETKNKDSEIRKHCSL